MQHVNAVPRISIAMWHEFCAIWIYYEAENEMDIWDHNQPAKLFKCTKNRMLIHQIMA